MVSRVTLMPLEVARITMALESGQLVAGRFQLDKMVGRGGMGSVWRARDGRLDMPCAVKFIEGEIAQNPEATMRFEREAKAAAQLRSPHVVQILDHGVWDGMPYIAMELLEGEDLGKRLSTRGRLSAPEISSVITQVCRALARAHTAGIVHRDLKPDNIFLCRDDDREIAKVVDFGIAKSANSGLGMDSKTRTGSLLGTPYYMSPEQASGARDKPVDSRSDLWSLAVIVYQCFTGTLPFDGDALGDLLVKIIVGVIPRPSDAIRRVVGKGRKPRPLAAVPIGERIRRGALARLRNFADDRRHGSKRRACSPRGIGGRTQRRASSHHDAHRRLDVTNHRGRP